MNYKNLGWLVSTILFYGVSIPYGVWFFYQTIIKDIVPDNILMLTISVISMLWYNYRNRKVGYGLTYLRNWVQDRKDAEWQANMRAKRERLAIQHHRNDITNNDRIAK